MKLSKLLLKEETRREEIKAITLQALDLAIKKYEDFFTDEVAAEARKLFQAANFELTKRTMSDLLQDAGVVPSSEVAQFIITQSYKIDTAKDKAKLAA